MIPPDSPIYPLGEDPNVWYVLFCRTCDGEIGKELPIPFLTAKARGVWATAHTDATGHNNWDVIDQPKSNQQANYNQPKENNMSRDNKTESNQPDPHDPELESYDYQDRQDNKKIALMAAALVHAGKTPATLPDQLIGYAKRLMKFLEE